LPSDLITLARNWSEPQHKVDKEENKLS
jgi:hypothetical protein